MKTHPHDRQHDEMAEDGHAVGLRLLEHAHLERRAALNVVASEVGHEIGHTLNFLRCLVGDSSETPSFSSEDAALARVEVERLRHMLGLLRRLKLPPPAGEAVPVIAALRRAADAVAGLAVEMQVSLSLSVQEHVKVLADRRLLHLLLRDMLADVLRYAAKSSMVEVRMTLPAGRDAGWLEVWSGAARMAPPSDSERFDPWIVMLSGSADLGLSVAYGVARALGWKLSAACDASGAGLRVHIPASALSSEVTP